MSTPVVGGEPVLLYLETDDEVTTVARRIHAATETRVVLVAPGRSRATSSVVALRLLARVGAEGGRQISVVGDSLTRSLAAESGMPAHATVDEARRAAPVEVGDGASRRAGISVVRGRPSSVAAGAVALPAGDVETRARPTTRQTAPSAIPERRAPLPLAVLAALATLLVLGAVAAAAILPSAVIVLTPRTEPLPERSYEITISDAERHIGTVEASATVTATGTYPIVEPATGVVVFLNWNVGPVDIQAGSLVAAGQQAFATLETVVVPSGSLTPDGRIQAGEEYVGVVAVAAGPAANVPAGAIDTVLESSNAARLRGFQDNDQRLVNNLEPTSGGLETTGQEITQQDVDAALAALLAELDERLEAELADTGDVFVDAGAAEPTIEGVDGLAGKRDQAEAEVSGSLAYDRLSTERDAVLNRARERFATDPDVLPDGHELLGRETSVVIREVEASGERLVALVSVSGASTPMVEREELIERVRGLPIDEARAELQEVGDVTIELWPGWVDSVPDLGWRIELRIEGTRTERATSPGASPTP